MVKSVKSIRDELVSNYVKTGKFTAIEIELSQSDLDLFVEFKSDPQRFTSKIFDGNWARPERKPNPGKIRFLRIVTGNDGVSRIIARQESRIFASPWI
jgi:hypothetical protein